MKGFAICPKGDGDALLASEQVWSVLMTWKAHTGYAVKNGLSSSRPKAGRPMRGLVQVVVGIKPEAVDTEVDASER